MKWNSVYQSKIEHQAQIVKDVLEDNALQAVVLSKRDSMYHIGLFEVQVPADKVMQALTIINKSISFE